LHEREQLNLVVIDPLAAFLPGRDEHTAAGMLEALLPLERLTARRRSVLVPHHPRRGAALAGQATEAYFGTTVHRLESPEGMAQGWHSGSGMVEGACQTMVGQRLQGAAMRWGAVPVARRAKPAQVVRDFASVLRYP
jgi:hypothetical protein